MRPTILAFSLAVLASFPPASGHDPVGRSLGNPTRRNLDLRLVLDPGKDKGLVAQVIDNLPDDGGHRCVGTLTLKNLTATGEYGDAIIIKAQDGRPVSDGPVGMQRLAPWITRSSKIAIATGNCCWKIFARFRYNGRSLLVTPGTVRNLDWGPKSVKLYSCSRPDRAPQRPGAPIFLSIA